MRKKYNLAVPDAIVAATSFMQRFLLVTADKKLMRVSEIEVINYNPVK